MNQLRFKTAVATAKAERMSRLAMGVVRLEVCEKIMVFVAKALAHDGFENRRVVAPVGIELAIGLARGLPLVPVLRGSMNVRRTCRA